MKRTFDVPQNVGDRGRRLIKEFEELRLEAYQDVAGVWTIGWGHTGPEVKKGMKISGEQAAQLFDQDLFDHAQPIIEALMRANADTSQAQLDAMVSLAYNIGVNAFLGSTLFNVHCKGMPFAACEQFLAWKISGGEPRRGLMRRRCREAALYCEDRW